MIRKIRIKFIAMFLVLSMILLGIILLSINISVQLRSDKQIESQLKQVILSGDEMGPMVGGDQLPITYAVFIITDDGAEIYKTSPEIPVYEITELQEEALTVSKSKGTIDHYRYIMMTDNGVKYVAFGNDQIQENMIGGVLNTTLVVGLISIIIITGIIAYVSRYVTRPTEIMIEKQKDFVANSSHELKIPLAVISAKADLLEIEYTKDTVNGIKNEVTKMDNVIKDLLYISKLDSLTKNTEAKMINISEIVEKVMLDNELLVFERNRKLVYDIKENIQVKAVDIQIIRVLEELLDNAIKYSTEKTNITVKLYTEHRKLHLSISNIGTGIKKEDSEKIFDRFYRVNIKGQSEIDGSGVGLSIVKTIADLNKIRIKVDSNEVDKVTFELIFDDFKQEN